MLKLVWILFSSITTIMLFIVIKNKIKDVIKNLKKEGITILDLFIILILILFVGMLFFITWIPIINIIVFLFLLFEAKEFENIRNFYIIKPQN
jgi:hypothetical protein